MATMNIHKLTAMPAEFEPHGLYYIMTGGRLRVIVADQEGTGYAATITDAEIQAMIDNAVIASGGNNAFVVDTIADRDAMAPESTITVLVLDASADPDVDAGAATYIWVPNGSYWTKISEAESMDVVQDWVKIVGRPASSVSQIDDAVSKRHAHANKTQIDKVGEDAEGNFTYGGVRPRMPLDTANW